MIFNIRTVNQNKWFQIEAETVAFDFNDELTVFKVYCIVIHNTTLWIMINFSVHSDVFHIKNLMTTHYNINMIHVADQKLTRKNRQNQYVMSNVDNNLSQWSVSICVWEKLKKMILKLTEMIIKHLKMWWKQNKDILSKQIMICEDWVLKCCSNTVFQNKFACCYRMFKKVYLIKNFMFTVIIIIIAKTIIFDSIWSRMMMQMMKTIQEWDCCWKRHSETIEILFKSTSWTTEKCETDILHCEYVMRLIWI